MRPNPTSLRRFKVNTNNIIQDTQSSPNYIPTSQNNNYINNNTTSDDIINNNRRQQNKQQTIDVIYDEMQMPILLAFLYFIFQLPICKVYLLKILPSAFNKDGNNNLKGYIINSVLFALSYYIIKNGLNFLTNI